MDRLTIRLTKTGAVLRCARECMDTFDHCGICVKWEAALDRLAAYEDTGLEPEEARELQTAHRTEYCESADYDCVELGEYHRAKAEGRLIVLPSEYDPEIIAWIQDAWKRFLKEAEAALGGCHDA